MKIYKKYAKTLTNKKRKSTKGSSIQAPPMQIPSQSQQRSIFSTIDQNFGFLNSLFKSGTDLVEGKYSILNGMAQIGVANIQGISDKKLISSQIIEPLLKGEIDPETESNNILEFIQSKFISVPNTKKINQVSQVVEGLLNGDTILFVEGLSTALIIGTRKVEKRAIDTPSYENTVSASMDSFVEDLETNFSLVIRRLPTPDLKFETFTVGSVSRTKVKLMWIEGIANKKAIEEAKRRINKIDIDFIDGIGVLSELIEDSPLSIFPKNRQTQRPDLTARYLANGCFAIICSNSPFALIAPMSFWDNFKTMDDYSERPLTSSYLRIIRYIAFLLSVLVSPLYLAFVAYNHSIVPPALAINIATGRDGVPFPSVVELIVLTLAITVIREASLRISGPIGFFISTLSAIVIGQASVSAGYVSASVIIVAAISSISSFANSTTKILYPSRLINLFFILLAGLFGMFGLINGVMIIFWHALSIESFGVPYLYPLIPLDLEALKDTFIRTLFRSFPKRQRVLAPFNRTRMGKDND